MFSPKSTISIHIFRLQAGNRAGEGLDKDFGLFSHINLRPLPAPLFPKTRHFGNLACDLPSGRHKFRTSKVFQACQQDI
jgi:hypothetical protein